jgi:plasmid stabilization system protein ParE
MAASSFRVVFTHSAFADIEEIVAYWSDRGEPERGEQYAHDLPAEAIRRLSDASTARSGRHLVKTSFPEAQELPVFKRSYRILYRIRENESTVEVLRFWHSHRDEPFRDA